MAERSNVLTERRSESLICNSTGIVERWNPSTICNGWSNPALFLFLFLFISFLALIYACAYPRKSRKERLIVQFCSFFISKSTREFCNVCAARSLHNYGLMMLPTNCPWVSLDVMQIISPLFYLVWNLISTNPSISWKLHLVDLNFLSATHCYVVENGMMVQNKISKGLHLDFWHKTSS